MLHSRKEFLHHPLLMEHAGETDHRTSQNSGRRAYTEYRLAAKAIERLHHDVAMSARNALISSRPRVISVGGINSGNSITNSFRARCDVTHRRFVMEFPELMPPTLITRDLDEIKGSAPQVATSS